jgi:hypothetical protein
MRYNTYQGNWRPATTTYQILAFRYRFIADSEDFVLLMPAHNNHYVAVPEISLPVLMRLFISSPVQGICSRHFIDPTNLIFVIIKR